MTTPLSLALNELSQRVLEQQRNLYAQTLGLGSDTKRPRAWCEYGFPEDLRFDDYFRLYQRHGVAHGAVHILLDKCWERLPQVIQGDEGRADTALTPWERKFNAEARRLRLWQAVKQADRRRLVGHYAGLILQIRDNKPWSEPARGGRLQRLIPAWEGQLKPASWDMNETSPRYGEPETWSYTQLAVQENEETVAPSAQVTIHWSRVVVMGDFREGVPFLQAGYNACVTMEKITGGSGESFLKNASRQLAINFNPEADLAKIAASYGVPLNELHTAFDEIAKGMNRGMDSVLGLQGGDVKTLVATVPDPQPPFNVAMMDFAASVQLPAKVLSGSQTGERASTGDIEAVNKRAQGRCENDLTCDVENLLRHCFEFKLLPAPPGLAGEFTVMWSDLAEATPSEKMEQAKGMAEVNAKMMGTGELVFSVDRIVTAAGYELEPRRTALPDSEPVDVTQDEEGDADGTGDSSQ